MPQVGQGSGVIINADGYIVTCHHLVGQAEDLEKALKGEKGGVMLEVTYEDAPGTYYYAFGL